MDFRSIWRWLGQRRGDTSKPARKPARVAPQQLADWEARIAAAGVAPEWATKLAPALAASQQEIGRDSATALIRGAALAVALQAESQAQVERSLRDVREVERLLGAFSGELEKLDEVLEVLAAYAQRMRPQAPAGSPRRTLH